MNNVPEYSMLYDSACVKGLYPTARVTGSLLQVRHPRVGQFSPALALFAIAEKNN